MLDTIGAESVDDLINQTVPASIRLTNTLDLPEGMTEHDYLARTEEIGEKNKLFTNFLGQGYYGTITPSVVKRNILENPGWYTAYTPYQAEISQGRLEGLLNFQTVVSDLTGLPIANASLLDEGTAAAEAVVMLYSSRPRSQAKAGIDKFFIDDKCYTQSIDVIRPRAEAVGVKLVIGDIQTADLTDGYFGMMLQYPDKEGAVRNYAELMKVAQENELKTVVASDLMALCLLEAPGDWGADVVVGNTQRFGVPMGYGGPHAGFFATREDYKRHIPGRIIGVSRDRSGRPALRMALQTREQHIRRDKATSNICTAQALLAIMASMYAVFHGPRRLKAIATSIAEKAAGVAGALRGAGYTVKHNSFYDTVCFEVDDVTAVKAKAEQEGLNLWYGNEGCVTVSIDETTSSSDISKMLSIFGVSVEISGNDVAIPADLVRTSEYLTHPTFNSYHSESEMMRYIKSLENKDISLTRSMISLGSCTMKLNAATELYSISNPQYANLHPFVPTNQAEGYNQIIGELHDALCTITGFDAVSFQPNSGAQGEYAGLMVIKAYHESNGNPERNIVLIPSSAHGTNPASAVVAGMKVVVVKCDEDGNIDVADLRDKAEQYADTLGALMVTYPSTHGVFEEAIMEITQIIHENGGQVYMDGANMNAQVGLTNPATIGADVCHLNLHKTFAIPHGGGGPGVGPIGVAAHLTPFLPGHSFHPTGGEKAISSVSSAPYGSALILLISHAYVQMLGKDGLTDSTKFAILNANYLKDKLKAHFPVLYIASSGRVAHEMILDCRPFKRSVGIEVTDIAKRLIDYGFHAPTVSFPVAGTLMVEPTESESQAELDRFAEALIAIRAEIAEIENGQVTLEESVVHNAPHTAETLMTDEWTASYNRTKAAFPLSWVKANKYWVPVSRIEDAYGDRNLICACPPMEMYEESLAEV